MSKAQVLVFAGPNGSGKSTIAKQIPHCGVYINADELKKEYALTDIEAAEKAEALRKKLIEKTADFTFETVLSTERNLLLLKRAKENDYVVHCIIEGFIKKLISLRDTQKYHAPRASSSEPF